MNRFACFLVATTVTFFAATNSTQANSITGTSIQSFSSQYIGSAVDQRLAENIINESGLSGGAHDTTQWHMWFTDGTVETTPTGFVVIDLGANYDLANIHVWNYNETGSIQPGFGAKEVAIWVSPDDNASNLVKLDNGGGDFVFPMATGASDYTGFDVNLSGVTNSSLLGNARLVKFEILGSWRDDVGFPNVNFVGLSEVQFTEVPEPGTVLLALVGWAGLIRRRIFV